MTGRKQGPSRKEAARPAGEIAGADDEPLGDLRHMTHDPFIDTRTRIAIARVRLPFVHPRAVRLEPPEPESKAAEDACRPETLVRLAQLLGLALQECKAQGREIPDIVWTHLKFLPLSLDELNMSPRERHMRHTQRAR